MGSGPGGRNGKKSHTGRYRLITTLTDHRAFGARDLIALHHQRWEIETCYLELKSSTLGARVLRARTQAGVDQEVYAVLAAYQTVRLAITDTATDRLVTDPTRARGSSLGTS